MTPVFPGYWGTVPVDFGVRNPGADVIAQDLWVGYQRPSWLNPASPLFRQVAADYYAIAEQVLGASTIYKMDPLKERASMLAEGYVAEGTGIGVGMCSPDFN